MHEMSMASSVLEAVRVEARKYEGAHVSKVGLRIGEWSGVDTESLRFCFEALVTGSDFEPLALEIDFRPASPHMDIAYLELEDG
jgi:hydrogenase nickel incorporation protein HypA/HybF